MNSLVYVPLIVHGRDKYEYHTISCGVFTNKKHAINGLLEKLVTNDFISYDMFLDMLSDRLCEIDEAKKIGEEIEPDDRFDNLDISNDVTSEQLTQHLQQKVNGDMDLLEEVCQSFGDSYYKDGWKFQIDEHVLSE